METLQTQTPMSKEHEANARLEQLNNLGVKHFLKGEFSKARERYEKALELSPTYATTLNNIGMLCIQEQSYTMAEAYFKKALEQKETATYHLNLGHAYANQGRFVEAEQSYTRSLGLHSENVMTWKSLAALHQHQENYERSAQLWETVVSRYSHEPYFKIQWARDLIKLEAFSMALEVLESATQQDSLQEVVWYLIAEVQLHLCNFGTAETAIKRSLAYRPDDLRTRALAAAIYLGASKLPEALAEWDYILTQEKGNHKIRMDKAVSLLAYGKGEWALKEIEQVLQAIPNDPKARFYKAMTLMTLKIEPETVDSLLEQLSKEQNGFSERASELLAQIRS